MFRQVARATVSVPRRFASVEIPDGEFYEQYFKYFDF